MIKKLFFVAFIFVSECILAQTPILENFRIENNQPSRVYFDVKNGDISTLTKQGFIISGKTISSINTDNSFTVSTPFTFWDNNTIRLENGDGTIHDFSLTYIKNNIIEPTASTNRYASVTGSGTRDGTSEANAWTLTQAFANARAGQTVWVKAGNYGNVHISSSNDGTATNPIKFIGYKSTIGDITSPLVDSFIYSSVSAAANEIDPIEYPVLSGTGTTSSNDRYGLYFGSANNIIIKNIQVRGYYYNIWISGVSSNMHFENITTALSYGTGTGGGGNAFLVGAVTTCQKIRVKKSLGIDNAGVHFRTFGKFNAVIDSKAWCGIDGDASTDYYYSWYKSDNSIFHNNEAIRVGNLQHSGHAFGLKESGTYNLISSNIAKNISESIYFAREDSHHNVAKNNTIAGDLSVGLIPSALISRAGAHNNLFENNIGYDLDQCIVNWQGNEDDQVTRNASKDNVYRNNIFIRFNKGVVTANQASIINETFVIDGVLIYNNTFALGNKDLFVDSSVGSKDLIFRNNEFKNNNIYSENSSFNLYGSYSLESHYVQQYNNYFNTKKSFTLPSGGTNKSLNPNFKDLINVVPTNINLRAGTPLVDCDFNLIERSTTNPTIGAIEIEDPTTGSVGPDVSICNGENTILTASGGSSYSWNNGETTASITVSPTVTTTYTVTISDGTQSDSHDIIVTVNEAPTVNAGSDQTICAGEDITLTASGVGNFLWSTGETTSSITVSPTITTTYTVTASNSCTDDATDQVIVNVTPGVNLTLGSNVEICLGESVTLTAQSNGDFLWNTGETSASITVSPVLTTIYSVTSSLGECSKSEEVTVTVNQAPSVNAGSDQTICAGEDITLTASGIGNFLWSNGETTSSITVSPTSTTTYTVTASNSCTDDATDQVIVNVTPGVNLTLGSDVEICLGESVTLTAQSNGDFLWNTGETSASITVSPVSTTIYSVTSSLGDCSKSEEVTVTVNQAPSVNAGSDQTICAGEDITLTASGVGNFLWSNGETTSSITVSPATTTTYTVTASNSCTDDATDQVIVTVNDKPTVSVSNDITIENGSSTVLTASGDGNFLWSTGETTSSITVSPSITTTYSVTLTSQQGCSETNSIEVIVTNNSETIVIADAGPDQDVCLDANVELTASGGDSYLWSTGETTPSISVSPTETTTYTVTVSNGSSIDVDDVIVFVDESCSELNNRLVLQDFKVYPNPTNGILHIELSGYSNELNLSLFNSTGKIIHSDIISNYSLDKSLKRNINLRKFGKGVYYARIVNNGKIETKKVIVM